MGLVGFIEDPKAARLWPCAVLLVDPDDPPPLPAESEEDKAALFSEKSPARLFRRRVLRALAAARLDIPAHAVRLTRDAKGKPLVAGTGLHVSLTSRPGRVAAAISAFPIGLDIESRAEDFSGLESVSPKGEAFSPAHRWAALEALAKLDGLDLDHPRGALELARDGEDTARLGLAQIAFRQDAAFITALAFSRP